MIRKKLFSIGIFLFVIISTIIHSNSKISNIKIDNQKYKDGNSQTISDYLISKANGKDITIYSRGDIHEMYTFEHDETEQTNELTDYRYIGNNPNNYVYFNCNDEDDNNSCEVWRIIGVFEVEDEEGNLEQRVKLIRNYSDNKSWDLNNYNEWSRASLNTYLNEEYYNELSNTAQDMIGNTKYYLGGFSQRSEQSGRTYYEFERGSAVYNEGINYWIGKIALMYPSDYAYTYALNVDYNCYISTRYCDQSNPQSGWIYNSNISTDGTILQFNWTLSPNYDNWYGVLYVANGSVIQYSGDPVFLSSGVRPVVYLISDIYIIDGDGTKDHPYSLSLNSPLPEKEEDNIDIKYDNIKLSEDDDVNENNDIILNKDNGVNENNNIELSISKNDDDNNKTLVNVENTLKIISNVVLISSLLLIISGIIMLLIYYHKVKR